MFTLEQDYIFVDQETVKLQGFRLEDTIRAPAVIIFVDDKKPELFALRQQDTAPTKIKSRNMETDIQVISYAEISSYMNQ